MVIMAGSNWSFLVMPVLVGALVIVLTAMIVNNLDKDRHYPKFWL